MFLDMKLDLKKVLAEIKPNKEEEILVKKTYNEFAKKVKNVKNCTSV